MSIDISDKMFKKMLILLFFSHCFAQGGNNFDFDPSSHDGKNLEDILRKLIALLNNDVYERISNIEADIEDIKDNIVRNEGKITKNNSARVTSVSEQHETMILNNIQRLNSMDNKMVDMRVKIISNEEKNVENSNTISSVNSVVEEHSALITSMSEQVEQQQAMIKNNTQRMDSITRNLTAEKSDKEEPGQTEPEENMGMPGQNFSQGDPGLAVTTSLPSSLAYQAILITGGNWEDRGKSAEIYLPSGSTGCSLPKLPEGREGHTQDGPWACGGGGSSSSTETTCDQWSEGSWTRSHSLRKYRRRHVSWATASGVYIIGGQSSTKTSELVKEDGSVEEGFKLKYTVSACAIPDPDKEEVIITGGRYTSSTVSVYSEAGWQRDLAEMTQGRYDHACSSFTHAGEKHLIVTGGYLAVNDLIKLNYLDSTEVYSFRDNAWTEAGKLPVRMESMRAATINNRVLLFGGEDFKYVRNDILEYDPETKKWTQIATMREARRSHAVSVVDFRDYMDSCQKN